MTCIVGYVEKGNVWIGGDSTGANVSTYYTCVRADEKVFKKNSMIFGFTSSFRMGQIIRYCFNSPKQLPIKSDYEYLCSDFVDALIKCFKDKEYATVKDGVVTGGQFLLGYRGELYFIDSNFQVSKTTADYDACGCGIDLALGAFHCMENMNFSPENRITKALEAASEFSAYVRPPFNIVSLKYKPTPAPPPKRRTIMQAKGQGIKPTTPRPAPPKGSIRYENGKHSKDCHCQSCRHKQRQSFRNNVIEKNENGGFLVR